LFRRGRVTNIATEFLVALQEIDDDREHRTIQVRPDAPGSEAPRPNCRSARRAGT
jgi:hypothetical protein